MLEGNIVSLHVRYRLGQKRCRMQQVALSVNIRVANFLGLFGKKLKNFLLLVKIVFQSFLSFGDALVRVTLVNEDTLIWVSAIRAEGKSHHELSLGHPGGIPGLRRTSIHLFHTSKPSIRIQRLVNRVAVQTELLTPLFLHVEFNLSALLLALDRLKKQVFKLRELPGLVVIQNPSGFTLKGSGAELGVLHLLGETRLLGLEHVSKELVEFDAFRDR
mmetsp:Transcript_23186/g.37707  ORF Transcript_23186/g.37707 Transcript_23186/m.37707 type:complete len:217 (+) Transcript_23186:1030-1680(+)